MEYFGRTPRSSALFLLASLAVAVPASAHAGDGARIGNGHAAELRDACRDDFGRLCKGVRPGGGRIIACLRDHAVELSPTCHQAMADAGALKDGAPGGGGPATR